MTVTVVFAGGSTRWRVYVDGAHVCSCDQEADAVWIARAIDQLKRGGESLKLEHPVELDLFGEPLALTSIAKTRKRISPPPWLTPSERDQWVKEG